MHIKWFSISSNQLISDPITKFINKFQFYEGLYEAVTI